MTAEDTLRGLLAAVLGGDQHFGTGHPLGVGQLAVLAF